MPDTNKFDMSYIPKSYWVYGNQQTKVEATVKGDVRRTIAKLGLEGDPVALTDRHAFDVSLTDEERGRRASMHPSLMSGEFLPDYDDGEVEIARVRMASVTGDIISIRAKWFEGQIHYTVTDEYDDEYGPYEFSPKSSVSPLTFGELICFIESTDGRFVTDEDGTGLVIPILWMNYEGQEPEDLPSFVEVTSPFYLELNAWYEAAINEWVIDRLKEQEEDLEDEDD